MTMRKVYLMEFENGFRLYDHQDPENKFFIIDECNVNIGDEFRVGPNGYFEFIGNPMQKLIDECSE